MTSDGQDRRRVILSAGLFATGVVFRNAPARIATIGRACPPTRCGNVKYIWMAQCVHAPRDRHALTVSREQRARRNRRRGARVVGSVLGVELMAEEGRRLSR
jgi:hypothetical protein